MKQLEAGNQSHQSESEGEVRVGSGSDGGAAEIVNSSRGGEGADSGEDANGGAAEIVNSIDSGDISSNNGTARNDHSTAAGGEESSAELAEWICFC
jgi:hypothetical protein